MAKPRDYKREMALWPPNATQDQSERHKARRKMEKLHGPIPKGMDVDHVNKNLKDKSAKNLQVIPASKNRSKK